MELHYTHDNSFISTFIRHGFVNFYSLENHYVKTRFFFSFFLSREVWVEIIAAMIVTETTSILICEPQPHLAPTCHFRLLTERPTPVPCSKYLFLFNSSAISQSHTNIPIRKKACCFGFYEYSSHFTPHTSTWIMLGFTVFFFFHFFIFFCHKLFFHCWISVQTPEHL